jgi:hypothetical protein
MALATLVLIWRWFLPRRAAPLACAALAPGVVYLYAVYPLSLLALSGVVLLRYLDRDERVAGFAGGIAALAYPLGLALVPVVAVVSLWRRRSVPGTVRRALFLLGPAFLACIAIVTLQRMQTGRWTAYFDVANEYGGLHNPATTITDWLTVLWRSSNPFGYSLVPIWQLLLVTGLLVAVTVAVIHRRAAGAVALLAWCVGVWFVPLLQSRQSLWRSEAALVLLAPLLALLPRPAVWAAVAALAVAAFGLAHEFFVGGLI